FAKKLFSTGLFMVDFKANAGESHLSHGNLTLRLNQITGDLPRSDRLNQGFLKLGFELSR
ncbi:MAG: hypothetical protein ACKOEW_06110, partial [Methylocystis sp.]